uniref:CD74 molecule, major histocompatibility complex, class II invariant chain a n=1 Tax=Oreochromis niloticus TaxID=8128 RepID=A0A669ECG3_ORENI
MILNQPIRAGATDPSHNFLFFFFFLIERLSVEPVWFSFPHFVGNLCSRRVVQCPVCCLKERKELLTQMAHSQDDAPLARGSLADSEEILLPPAAPRGGSNSRALKIAGLTTLACLLVASQVFTAYTVFSQKQQIHTLQKNSDRMNKQLTRSSHAVAPVRMAMPMNSLPLLMDFTEDSTAPKTPLTKLQDTAIVSVEKQLMDLMQDSELPQFNETFLANLQTLKQHMNDSEWKSFETWMRYWLIFKMAQQQPATPTPQSAISANDRLHAALQLLTLLSLMSSFCVESCDFNHFLWLLEIGSIEACYTLVHLILKKKIAFTSDLFWGLFI